MSGTTSPLASLLPRYDTLTKAPWPVGPHPVFLRWARLAEPLLLRAGLIETTYRPPAGYEEEEVPKAAQAPTAGTYMAGDRLDNSSPVILGSVGSKYFIDGWTCVQGGSPGVWEERRVYTGK